MPTLRRSSKAALVAGALAVTLVVGATSGAVAGKLITSKDIKNNTVKSADIKNGTVRSKDLRANAVTGDNLASGAVTWDKSLDQATKDLIEALVQDGAPGPAGATGPAGPAGSRGPAGPAGGGLVGSKVYVPGDFVEVNDGDTTDDGPSPDDTDPFSKVDSTVADLISLPGPGTYLISVQAGSLSGGSPFVFFDDPGPVLDLFDPSTALQVFARSCLGVSFGCQASIPYVVPAGAPASVPLNVFSADCGCGPPDQVTVTVFKMDDTPAAYSKVVRRPLRGHAAREYAALVEELRASRA